MLILTLIDCERWQPTCCRPFAMLMTNSIGLQRAIGLSHKVEFGGSLPRRTPIMSVPALVGGTVRLINCHIALTYMSPKRVINLLPQQRAHCKPVWQCEHEDMCRLPGVSAAQLE